jgi:hypothetical protein
MRIDTQTIRPVAALDGGPAAQSAPAMRFAAVAAALVTIAAVLLACGLAVMMNLS